MYRWKVHSIRVNVRLFSVMTIKTFELLSIILRYVINLILPKVLYRFISCSKLKLYIY